MRTAIALTVLGLATGYGPSAWAGGEGLAPTASSTSVTPAATGPAATKPQPPRGFLCDDKWIGGFETVEIGGRKYDGSKLRDYDPQHPEVPWSVRGERYMLCQHEKDMMYTLLGRFWDRKETDKFLGKVETDPHFISMTSPSYPPVATGLGAYLASDQYTCTLDRSNPIIDPSNWIVELDGYLFAGDATECKQGKYRKVVTVIDCTGKKNLVTDTWAAPCDAGPVSTCIVEMSPGMFGIQQDYSHSSEGRQLSFRVYDVAKRRKVFAMTEGYDMTGGQDAFVKVRDVDNDGVPELEKLTCEGASCQRASLRKWDGRAFVDVPAK